MIVIDYSGVALANVLTFGTDLETGDIDKILSLCRHTILNSILSYKKKYESKYGEIVIACDGRQYWRKQKFPFYKHHRKLNREESPLNWDAIFKALDDIKQSLKDVFPYKVIEVHSAEADDVIATLAKWSQTNDVTETFFETDMKPYLIISADNDFIQLQKYKNVAQWSPFTKKMINVNMQEVKDKLLEHIVKGDRGDGVMNILSHDETFINGERQKTVSAKRLAEFKEKGFDACRDDFERRNWQRNETLVNLDKVPEDVSNAIIESFLSQSDKKRDLEKIMNFLIKNRCGNLLDQLQDF